VSRDQFVRQRQAQAEREVSIAQIDQKQAINQAVNTLSEAQINLQAKLALIQALPKIIEESVRPMEKIDSIRIMQVDGLKTSGGGAGAAAVNGADGGGNLAEQAVGAALRYRAYAPVLDRLLQEVGLAEHGMMGILGSVAPGVAVQTGGAVQVNAGATGGHAGGGGQVGRHWDRRRR